MTPVATIKETQRQRLAAHVTVEITDPTHPDARHCLSAYVAELARRFDQYAHFWFEKKLEPTRD